MYFNIKDHGGKRAIIIETENGDFSQLGEKLTVVLEKIFPNMKVASCAQSYNSENEAISALGLSDLIDADNRKCTTTNGTEYHFLSKADQEKILGKPCRNCNACGYDVAESLNQICRNCK